MFNILYMKYIFTTSIIEQIFWIFYWEMESVEMNAQISDDVPTSTYSSANCIPRAGSTLAWQ